jgi:hypothetical protein
VDDRFYFSTEVGDGVLERVQEVVGHEVAGVVDKNLGGIIAYAHPEQARVIVAALMGPIIRQRVEREPGFPGTRPQKRGS